MIDVHNHLLVDLDDGSRSLEQSRLVLEHFRSHGVTDVICTPHLSASAIDRFADEAASRRDGALDLLRKTAPDGIALHAGFEVMLDQPLSAAALADRRIGLAGSRYVLVEFPLNVAAGVTVGILEQMAGAGMTPLVAHPERYAACDAATVRAWKAVGATAQVDATTLTRPTKRGQRARALLAAGLADVLAADNHGDGRGLWTGRDFVAQRGGAAGQRVARMLVVDNPGKILADTAMEAVEPVRLRLTLGERFRGIWS